MEQSDFDRKIEVITGILANVSVKHQLHEERMKDWDERMDRAERRMIRVENILKLAIRAGRRERREWREKYAALVDAQMRSEAKLERVEEAQARTEETMNRLAEVQAHSDRKFEAFMDAVRRDVERRGGRQSGEAKDEGASEESGES